MPVATQIALAEYLQRNDEPACELISGQLLPKPMGTIEHGRMQRRIMRLLEQFEASGSGEIGLELPVRHGDDVRIPDIAFLPPDARFEDGTLVTPPLLCIEVISPSQRPSELFAKCEDYHSGGVPYGWVVDPIQNVAWEYHKDSMLTTIRGNGLLEAGQLRVPVSELFPA